MKRPLSKGHKLVFNTNYRLMQVKSIAECSNGSILQYFRPSLSYHLSLRSLFCLFLSDRFTRFFLLYVEDRGVSTHMRRLAGDSSACIHKVWMDVKTQSQFRALATRSTVNCWSERWFSIAIRTHIGQTTRDYIKHTEIT